MAEQPKKWRQLSGKDLQHQMELPVKADFSQPPSKTQLLIEKGLEQPRHQKIRHHPDFVPAKPPFLTKEVVLLVGGSSYSTCFASPETLMQAFIVSTVLITATSLGTASRA